VPQALEATSWRPASPPPPPADTTVYAQRGDRLGDVAQRYGVDERSLREANPDLAQAQSLPLGQPVRLPAPASELSPAVAGISAAGGREGLVQALQTRAYDAGRVAPQQPFDATVYRAVPTRFEGGALDHNFGSPGRYNAGGQGMLYTSPDAASMLHENAAYASAGQHPLADKSVIELGVRAAPGPDGRGGVADLAEGARRQGLPLSAFTETKGGQSPSLLHQLTGEHPYTLPQQASKGASDAGAVALRAPSATGGQQIDIVPRNAQPHQVMPQQVTRYDSHGNVASSVNAGGVVQPMPADARPYADGPLDKSAGTRPPMQAGTGGPPRLAAASTPGQPLGAANQGPEAPQAGRTAQLRQGLTGAQEGYPRAASTRYGAVGGGAATLIDAGVRAARGERVDASDVATATATNVAVGGGAAKAVDLLTPRLGLVKAGGAVGGLVQAGVSGYSNVQAYRAGEISGSRAVANTVVDTGTAVAAGAAGAWVGAAVGSVVPVAGTAVGAVVGFGVGVGAHYAIGALDKATGLTSAAKDALASGLESVSDGASKAWNAIKPW
jgi:LysM repeat protein